MTATEHFHGRLQYQVYDVVGSRLEPSEKIAAVCAGASVCTVGVCLCSAGSRITANIGQILVVCALWQEYQERFC